MEKKLTAVEWFLNELQRMQYFIGNDMLQAYNQALAMEKEQHEKTALHFSEKVLDHIQDDKGWEGGDFEFKNYYTKTYGK
jgi:hypothetical protein